MKVSIIIPVYNVAKYIERCITSIVKQTLQDFEVVIVNDFTPDNSIELLEEMIGDDDRFVVINHPQNLGLMRARQTGYRHAKGDYFVFLDSDDELPLDAIETLYKAIKKTRADIVVGNFENINVKGEKKLFSNKLSYGEDKISVIKSLLAKELSQSLCGKIYKRDLFKNYEYITHDHFLYSEDGLLFYQLIDNVEKVTNIDEIVYYYYQNEQSITNKGFSDNSIRSIVLFNTYIISKSSKYPDFESDFYKRAYRIFHGIVIRDGHNRRLKENLIKNNIEYVLNYTVLNKYFSSFNALYYYLVLNTKVVLLPHSYLRFKIHTRVVFNKLNKLILQN